MNENECLVFKPKNIYYINLIKEFKEKFENQGSMAPRQHLVPSCLRCSILCPHELVLLPVLQS
jgi:hypothetical protein